MSKAFGAVAKRAVRTASGKADSHNRMVRAVRAACRRLGISEEDRRAIQQEETGRVSLGQMTLAEIGKVLDRLNRDWKGPMGHRAHAGKIRALWWTLYWLGAVEEPDDRAIDAFVKRQTGVSALRFLDHRKAFAVIEALKAMAARAGVQWPVPAAGASDALADRRAVVVALWDRLADTGTFRRGGCGAYLSASLHCPADLAQLGRHELDAAIKLLGKRVRRLTHPDRRERE